MKKVIIGIHGLENKPSKRLLQEWWKQSMAEGLFAIGKYQALPDFELVYWADVIYDKPLNTDITDENDPYFLDEIYTPITTAYQTKVGKIRMQAMGFIVRVLKKVFLNKDLSLKNIAIAGNILERYFKELDTYYKEPCDDVNCKQCKARQEMTERIVSVLRKYRKCEIFLIGHSMGSILAFDAIAFELTDIHIHTFVTIGSPIGLPVVISKVASKQGITGNGSAKLHTPEAIERNWYNYSDIEDMVSINNKLSEEFEPNSHGIMPIDVLVKNNYTMGDRNNPHSVYGYLRTKELSEVLAAFIAEEQPGAIKTYISKVFELLKTKSK